VSRVSSAGEGVVGIRFAGHSHRGSSLFPQFAAAVAATVDVVAVRVVEDDRVLRVLVVVGVLGLGRSVLVLLVR